ncbi:MAG: hypothetical protein JXB05_13235 [Myxococcaceae bacterium]|nr:hypothetical protein [Myxococcaceae bacterium]
MKKVLIGVGIGCGVLILVGVIALVAGGIWMKGKVEGMAEGGEKMQKQEQHITSLNQKYAFEEPPKGKPLPLAEDRLEDYFAIRKSLTQVFASYEQRMKEFESSTGKQADLSKGFEALGTVMGMMAEVREKWLEQLDAQKMSPREFHAITAALYSSNWGKAKGQMRQNQRAALEQVKLGLEKQANDESLPAAQRERVRKHLAMIEKQLAAIPPATTEPSEAEKIHTANAALYEKYKAQIEEGMNPGLDAFLVGDNNGLGKAFEDAMGEDALPELPAEEELPADEAAAE